MARYRVISNEMFGVRVWIDWQINPDIRQLLQDALNLREPFLYIEKDDAGYITRESVEYVADVFNYRADT